MLKINIKHFARQYQIKGSELLIFIALVDLKAQPTQSYYLTLKTFSKKIGLKNFSDISDYFRSLQDKRLIQFYKLNTQSPITSLYKMVVFPKGSESQDHSTKGVIICHSKQ